MNKDSVIQVGLADISAILFVVGGVASLVMSLLTIPAATFGLPISFALVIFVIWAISLVCSLGAIHCYTLATQRLLSEAGMRGLIFGALLLIFSLGFVGDFRPTTSSPLLAEVSAALVLTAGGICFVLRHSALSNSPPMMQRQAIPQRA
jgi:hypothetical protein